MSNNSTNSKEEFAVELELLRAKISELESTINTLMEVIVDNDLEDEVGVVEILTPEMEVCINGINQILKRVRNGTHDSNDVKDFDILNKNLRLCKGKNSGETKAKKEKPAKVEDLLKIVNGVTE